MVALSSADLAYMRDTLAMLMPDTCNILAPTNGLDAQGNPTQTWGTVAGGTAVPCRLDAYKGNEVERGAAVQAENGYVLTVAYSVSIAVTNRVQHGGYTYTVTSVDPDKSWAVTRRVMVERL